MFREYCADLVDDEGGEHEDEEADVERGEELLPVGEHHRPQQLPRPAPPASSKWKMGRS